MAKPASTVRILGLDFFQGTPADAVNIAKAGGLVVAPSAPGLITLPDDAVYRAALVSADVCLLDSGLLAFLGEWRMRRRLARVSGYHFLDQFLTIPELREPAATLFVAPSSAAAERSRTWLANNCGLPTPVEAWYVAPHYPTGEVTDEALLSLVRARRPQFILLNIGGGPQEKLGAWLKSQLDYRPAILCTGAAIAFLTGEQARIPDWADRARLGWLIRCIKEPSRFVPRYWQARRLVALYRRWGEQLPQPGSSR